LKHPLFRLGFVLGFTVFFDYFILFCIILSIYFLPFLRKLQNTIAHNVPAVYDVLPARMRACVARPGLAKCAGATAWE
jgi:hypothetical protein